jgi:hypothetical protein
VRHDFRLESLASQALTVLNQLKHRYNSRWKKKKSLQISLTLGAFSTIAAIVAIPNVHNAFLNLIDAHPIVGSKYTEKGVDYTNLRDFLKAKNFQLANREMMYVFHLAVNKPSGESLSIKDMETFPCRDLQTIDTLWSMYSKGKFSFSKQNDIFVSLGGELGHYDSRVYELFSQQIGWRKKNKLLPISSPDFGYSLKEAEGHLPIISSAETTLPPYIHISIRLSHCKVYAPTSGKLPPKPGKNSTLKVTSSR